MANQISGLFQKLIQNPKILAMAQQMYGSMQPEGQMAFAQGAGKNLGLLNDAGQLAEGAKLSGVNAAQLGSLALGAAKAHPFKTAGLISLGAGNIGGLTDNDKFGGQLGGLALGGLGSYLMEANPYAAAMMTMGGGALGSLFDKLRAKREAELAKDYYPDGMGGWTPKNGNI